MCLKCNLTELQVEADVILNPVNRTKSQKYLVYPYESFYQQMLFINMSRSFFIHVNYCNVNLTLSQKIQTLISF